MKTAGLVSATALCMGAAFFAFWCFQAQAKGPLQQIKNFQIYYAEPTAEALAALRKTGMAIVEPQLYTPEQVAELKEAGTLPAAYLSVMESPTWNEARTKRLQPGDYLLQGGQRTHFAAWDSYLMDPRQPSYRRVLLDELGAAVEKGFPAVMLDTVGDIDESVKDPALREELQRAYVTLLREMQSRFPGLYLIQNRGFGSLPAASPYLQGFLWEDWRGDWRQDGWLAKQVELVRRYERRGLAVFAVSSRSEPKGAREAGKLRFIHLETPSGYDKLN
ncbi:endo alpha-1,4 polygalactosaminidase [Paenibacillus sp. S-38]|uniref:endo alpha-1,4 polygalactosaminidase n=1 Tax=Paenibacillus sp. S-38 TaxID=3416710 RepID=UPI003CE72B92